MIPKKLTLENYKCYNEGEINFDDFNIAVIIGQQSGNSNVSNAVGKTAIFDAIEYCLFNHSKSKLDNLINDNATDMSVSLSFCVGEKTYKIVRKRSKKSADVSLFLQEADEWKDMSGRRASDTEELIKSIINIDFNIFKSTAYFCQNDEFSLALATPETRKKLLKDILDISFYSKLEKTTKELFNKIEKDNDKLLTEEKIYQEKTLSDETIDAYKKQILLCDNKVNENLLLISNNSELIQKLSNSISEKLLLISKAKDDNISNIELISSTKEKEKNVKAAFEKQLEVQKEDLSIGKSKVADKKKVIASLEEKQIIDISLLIETSALLKAEEISITNNIQQLIDKLNLLKEPIVSDICTLCGSTLDKEHLSKEKERISIEKQKTKELIATLNLSLKEVKIKLSTNVLAINAAKENNSQRERLEKILSNIVTSIAVHKQKYEATVSLLKSLDDQFKESVLASQSLPDISGYQKSVDELNSSVVNLKTEQNMFIQTNKQLEKTNQDLIIQKTMLNKSLDDNKAIINSIDIIKGKKLLLQDDLRTLPYIAQAFSSTGIPSIIISSILDELQLEANDILKKIHPGLQLQFVTEKERKKDKEVEDKLLIEYFIHNKERSYDELSGAQSISVQFALKIGLAFLLKRSSNYDFGLLLLDEVDSPLDKQSIGFFSEVLKNFQNDFKILTITHNEYSKEKIPNHILIEQDKTKMITRIK